MIKTIESNIVQMPNMILVAGNGRNVGKTYLACKIIEKLSVANNVIAVKISPHFHKVEGGKVLINSENVIIIEEDQISHKDSSLMLQAGAGKVYFVMARKKHIKQALDNLKKFFKNEEVIVCESGGLREVLKPGAFIYVMRRGEAIAKTDLMKFMPRIIENDGVGFSFKNIEFKNNQFYLE